MLMVWGLPKLDFGLLRRGVTFYTSGMIDRATFYRTGKLSNFSKCVARKLYNCEPLTKHFTRSALNQIPKALNEGEYSTARGLAAFGTTENADPFCVALIEDLIELCAKGNEVEFDLTIFGED